MRRYILSLWLPISRPNFYTFAAAAWMGRGDVDQDERTVVCWSKMLADDRYVPLMQAPVLRRLLEVMPMSFGYGREGRCQYSGVDLDEGLRPTSVEMTLALQGTSPPKADTPFWRANHGLVEAGVATVTVRVDENGNYMFAASYADSGDPEAVKKALSDHIFEIFGGEYVVHPLRSEHKRRHDQGVAALKTYNGLRLVQPDNDGYFDEEAAAASGHDLGEMVERVDVLGPPLGILNFFQLNTLIEGLWNDMLLPAVYLEQDRFMSRYLNSTESVGFFRTVGDLGRGLTVEADSSTAGGQIDAFYAFLGISAHRSLMRLKSALDSVRRRILDEMMGALHRQSRLVQLNFSPNDSERTPEQATSATESQLRGYASLVAAKLPLITNVREVVDRNREHLRWAVEGPDVDTRPAEETKQLQTWLWRLDGQLNHWKMLLDELSENVSSLSRSIEQAWMERVLYELQQSRSEQEAMAEIERSRQSRPSSIRSTGLTYNMVMLVLAVVAVVATLAGIPDDALDRGFGPVLVKLAPTLGILAVIYIVPPGFAFLRRIRRENQGVLNSYPYEFAFRLDEPASPERVRTHLRTATPVPLTVRGMRKLHVTNRGFGSAERVSADTTLLKTHSVATFRPSRWQRRARFEIINEILAHKIADNTHHILVQCRMFGDSPRRLEADEVTTFLRAVLGHIGKEIALDGKLDLDTILEESIYGNHRQIPRQVTRTDTAGATASTRR